MPLNPAALVVPIGVAVAALAVTVALIEQVLEWRASRRLPADGAHAPPIWRRGGEIVRRFLLAEEGPVNLALARIWFFAALPFLLPRPAQVKGMASLPESLQFPPTLLGGLVADLHLTPDTVGVLWIVIVVGCVLASAGVFARTAALIVTLAAFVYVGEYQLYGKVNHNHHLLWIAAVFAVARCADALSLGVLIRGARGSLPVVRTLPRSRAYALPLRAIWLLIGFVYLFPGLWKAYRVRLEWFDPDTLRHHLWQKWAELDGYRPFLQVDEFAPLLVLGAAGTLAFELGFILLLVTRPTRHLAALAGLGFHKSTGVMMQISFWTLQAMYPMLVDWEWLSRKVWARRTSLVFIFDGQCGICKRTVSVMQRSVLPGSLAFASVQNEEALDRHGVPAAMRNELAADLHVWDGSRAWTGYAAYRRLVRRQPFLWPLLPLLYLPPVRVMGERVYRRVADSRTCRVDLQLKPKGGVRTPHARPVLAFTVPLLIAVLVAGVSDEGDGWPVAVYPTFAYIPDDTTNVLRFQASSGDGPRRDVLARDVLPLGAEQLGGLTRTLVEETSAAERRLAFRELAATISTSVDRRYSDVWMRRDVIAVPPDQHQRVISTETLAHLRLNDHPIEDESSASRAVGGSG
jgi:predicted DCC family thiol-disulfide oxidoreductase YuxK